MRKTISNIHHAALIMLAQLLVAPTAQADDSRAADRRGDVTVVTLFSEYRSAAGTLHPDDTAVRPPIQIVDGGVKSAGPSCWYLTDSGQIVPEGGDCYVLRSAAPSEKPPVR
ncbi:hypothetical protein BL241_03490 [Ralstonia solanacearum]|uniref:Uncharacterized protein n=1 Tax=Ralstonia solanacearum TaxID=305 RepID=A0A0S4U455_RALSL|nr:hypothetical protein BL241_03490 [Ralstonia solanacearum]CUV17032.1 conserved exported protein of unknown function [Ralstonia solanacearum]